MAVPYDLCSPQTLTAADGTQLTACAHGGHILGWTPAGGRPRLWLSPTAECGPGLAIRGGVPVIFPQFADRGPLPKHGLARNRGWQVQPAAETDQGNGPGVRWQAQLTDDDATRAIWPHRFELTLTAEAGGDRLEITLTVRNTGDEEWSFAAALHAYLALADPDATIEGLGGRPAEDNANDGTALILGVPGELLKATDTRDVAIPGVSELVFLNDRELGRLVISADGFPDRVVWNPGPKHGLSDVPDGDEANFVCIEPAALTPVTLAPQSSWSGRQRLQMAPD